MSYSRSSGTCIIRTAATAALALGLALVATRLAAGRRVGQAALGVERLFAGREEELLATIHTRDAAVACTRHGLADLPGRR